MPLAHGWEIHIEPRGYRKFDGATGTFSKGLQLKKSSGCPESKSNQNIAHHYAHIIIINCAIRTDILQLIPRVLFCGMHPVTL